MRADIFVTPATAELWPDVEEVQSRGSCWCQRSIGEPGDGDRAGALRRQLDAEMPIGLLAYRDGRPVGWTRVMPRAGLPGVLANRALQKVLDDRPDAWWVVCFSVVPRSRRSGVGDALLAGAVAFARDQGASVLDGHPVDVAKLTAAKISGSAVFTGTLEMFERNGFTELGRTYSTRPVMRHTLR